GGRAAASSRPGPEGWRVRAEYPPARVRTRSNRRGALSAGQPPGPRVRSTGDPEEDQSMRSFALPLLAVGLTFTARAAPAPYLKKDPRKADLQKTQGTGDCLSLVIRGEPVPLDELATVVVIAGRLKTYRLGDEERGEWVITLDARRRPKVFDMRWTG